MNWRSAGDRSMGVPSYVTNLAGTNAHCIITSVQFSDWS